jgi:hypothetical protein
MTDDNWLAGVLAKPTASVPDAGRAVFDIGRNASYDAAKRGAFPLIDGPKKRVPTVWIRRKLGIGGDA